MPFSSLPADGARDDAHAVDPDRLLPAGQSCWPGRWASAPQRWPDEQVEAAETLALVAAAITALAPVQREVVRLRDVEGWEAGEVCTALGLSAGNQRVLLHRGRGHVRAALEEYVSGSLVN